MCVEPATATILTTLATTLVTTAISTYADYKSTSNENSLLIEQAKTARKEAAVERQEGLEESRRAKLQAILNMGNTKTQIASGNILTSSGTAVEAVNTDKLNGDIEALSTLKSAENRAQKYIAQSDLYYKKAGLNTESFYLNSALNLTSNLSSSVTSSLKSKLLS